MISRCLPVAIAAAVAVLYAAEKKEPAPRTLDELKAAIGRILTETKTPGAGIAIVTRDQIMLADGVGKASVGDGRPADADTLFRIGSVSKAFATLSILKLQEEGRLQLRSEERRHGP